MKQSWCIRPLIQARNNSAVRLNRRVFKGVSTVAYLIPLTSTYKEAFEHRTRHSVEIHQANRTT